MNPNTNSISPKIGTLIICLVLILDQISKNLVYSNFEIGESLPVIADFFNLTLVMNPGAAFGLFSSLQPEVRRVVLGVVSTLAMILVFVLLKNEAKDDKISQICLYGILGGALGNVIDRFKYDAVVDFLDVYYKDYHWPAFNIADSAISLGVCILLIRLSFFTKKIKDS